VVNLIEADMPRSQTKTPRRTGALDVAIELRAFSSEVDTGSREENASK
jgi:hypothetical protein